MDLYYDYLNDSTYNVLAEQKIDLASVLEMLGPDNSFISFDSGIATEEAYIFGALKVNKSADLSFSVPFNDSEYTSFLESIGNDKDLSSLAASAVGKIINNYIKHADESVQCYSTTYKATNDELKIPLWHTDPGYGNNIDTEYKFVITLKGPGTLFCKLSEDPQKRSEEINAINLSASTAYYSIENRMSHAKLCSIEQGHKIYQAKALSGVALVSNNLNFAAVHAVPSPDSERIFLTCTSFKK